jgi:uncharacterized protein (TIGR00730 family)
MNICVFCASSDAIPKQYFESANLLAEKIAARGHALVYGGAKVGLMGLLARTVTEYGGKVIGVMPERIFEKNLDQKGITEFIVTKDMHSRKQKLEELADAFVVLPGGLGTIEEFAEVLTLKQLEYHSKPIVVINTDGFYDRLFEFFEIMGEQKFSKPDYSKLYDVVENIDDALRLIENYTAPIMESKWFKTNLNV